MMDMEEIKRRWPDIKSEELYPLFPAIPVSDYPELQGYSRKDVYDGAMAPGGLFLASDMAKLMPLEEGMRVLDMGPGNGASSRFLAKHYGVRVFMAELWIDPSKNWERVKNAGLEHSVFPMKVDARDMPFAEGFFDAAFSMDAFAYFMTDDLYPSYLSKFLRPGGRICIGGHCYTSELTPETPKEFLWDISRAYHSPPWWLQHFENTEGLRVVHCEEHPRGRELWLDDVRRCLEICQPKEMKQFLSENILHSIVMLLTDKDRFVSQFILVAEKKEDHS
jgi:SAM-dependent methyltransferase